MLIRLIAIAALLGPAAMLGPADLSAAAAAAALGPTAAPAAASPPVILVTRDPSLPSDRPPATPMLRRLAGAIDAADGPRFAALQSVLRAPPLRAAPDSAPIAFLTLHICSAAPARTVTLARDDAGGVFAIQQNARGDTTWSRLDPDRFRNAGFGWIDTPVDARTAAPVTPDTPPVAPTTAPPTHPAPGQITRLAPPYTPATITLTPREVSRRMPGRNGLRFGELARTITNESFQIRLPKAHNPAAAAGLLVWISPMASGEPPRALHDAADELNFIIIGADNSGNDRPPIDRMQLALDAAATASARYLIDESRIYAVGMSGGGRMASVMWCNAPDVFTGAIGIVGLYSPHMVRAPDGRMGMTNDWPARDLRKLIADHPIAGIGGPPDFNHDEMAERIRQLTGDGFTAKMFSHADMAHTMPTPGRFAEALRWVDAPWRARRAAALSEAQKLLAAYNAQHGETPPPDDTAAAALEHITDIAPWSAPALAAAKLLGYAPEPPSKSPSAR